MLKQLSSRLTEQPAIVDVLLPQSAVLVLIDELNDKPTVVLTRRAQHLRLHAGEIAFPGGRCDAADPDPWATALREAHEEVALPSELVNPLGYMEPVVTRTGIQVMPCVGQLRAPCEYVANKDELDCVFEVPLAFLAEPKHLQLDDFVYREKVRGVPRYEYQEFTIWGITAAILVQLVNLALDANLELEKYWKGRA